MTESVAISTLLIIAAALAINAFAQWARGTREAYFWSAVSSGAVILIAAVVGVVL